MMPCHSSGSSCSASSIEPFTSAKRAVTCLRSPSSADLDCRILSARCLGVYERGSCGGRESRVEGRKCPPSELSTLDGRLSTSLRAPPHLPQNLKPGGFAKPHFGQPASKRWAQLPQNFIPSGLSKPHPPQIIHRVLAQEDPPEQENAKLEIRSKCE